METVTSTHRPEVDAMVEDNGYATTDELFSGSYADLSDQPDLFSGRFADLTEFRLDSAMGTMTPTHGGPSRRDGRRQRVPDQRGLGRRRRLGTVIYTRCAWTNDHADHRAVHRPRAQAYGKIGVTGNVKTGLAARRRLLAVLLESSGY